MKTLLLRLDECQAAQIQTVARVDRLTLAEEIREAISAHIEARRADPEFQKRLRMAMERDRESYEGLYRPSVLPIAGCDMTRTAPGDDAWGVARVEGGELDKVAEMEESGKNQGRGPARSA